MKKKELYPAVKEAEQERVRVQDLHRVLHQQEPDMIGMAPNYEKFEGWTTEEVLVWLNID